MIKKTWKKVFAVILTLMVLVTGINWTGISVQAETTGEKEISSEVLLKNVETNSEETNSPAANVFKDEGTWHSNWSSTNNGQPSSSNKIWIQTGFDEVKAVSKISVTPVADDGYGYRRINQYEISVATLEDSQDAVNDDDFTVVKRGNLENKEGEQDIVFDEPVVATHIRITIISMHLYYYNNYATASRIRIFENPDIEEMPELQIVEPMAGSKPSEAYIKGYTTAESTVVPSEMVKDDITLAYKSGTTEFVNDEGHYAVKGCYTASSATGKLNITGNRPFVIHFDMKLPSETANGTYAVIGKMDNQYGVQVIVSGQNVTLQMYCEDSNNKWPTYRTDLGEVLGQWVSVTAVYDGQKFWMKADEGSFEKTSHIQGNVPFALKSHGGSIFSFGGRHDRSDYNFPGLLSNMSMYVAAADSTAEKTYDQIDEMVTSMHDEGTLAFATDVLLYKPYTLRTTWTDAEGNEVTAFEAGNTYTAEIVLEAIEGRCFTDNSKPQSICVNGVTVALDENAVVLSDDKETITVTYTYKIAIAKFAEVSASLNGTIGMNFYVEVNDEAAVNTLSVNLSRPQDEAITSLILKDAEFVEGKGYKFTYNVPAKEMTDLITAKIMNGEDVISTTSLSVKKYAETAKQYYRNDTELVALLDAMLDYGTCAQLEFAYNTENLANDGREMNFSDVEIDASEVKVQDGITSLDVTNVSLLLEADTTLRFYMTMDENTSLENYNAGEYTLLEKGNYVYADISNIAAKDIDESYTLTIADENDGTVEVTYSPLNYAKAVVESDTTSETLKNVVKALYLYNQAANTYFASAQ